MRKNDPIKRQYIILAVCFALAVVGVALQLIEPILGGTPSFFLWALIGLLVLYALLAIFTLTAIRRTHKRIEQRRQQAIAGDQSLLADPQPTPNEQALPLPTTLALHVNVRFFLILGGFIILCLIIGMLVGFFVVLHTIPSTRPTHHVTTVFVSPLVFLVIIVAAIIFVSLIVVIFALVFYNLLRRQEITIDEQGIITKYFGKTTAVRWSEARCFDLWGGKTRRMLPFEIIGEHGVVRWQIPDRYQFFYQFTPTIPQEEFRQTFAAMQQVITAKTGLPLYDLRDKKLVWW